MKREEITRLSLYARVAFTASIVEPVLGLYSEYFWNKFSVRKVLDEAWRFVSGGTVTAEEVQRLIEPIAELSEEADAEGYPFGIMYMHAEVLGELVHQDGKSTLAAIENAAYGFAAHHIFVQGFVPGDANIPETYIGLLIRQVNSLLPDLYDHYLSFGRRPVPKNEIRFVLLPAAVPLLSLPGRTIKPKILPPDHERHAIRSRLRPM